MRLKGIGTAVSLGIGGVDNVGPDHRAAVLAPNQTAALANQPLSSFLSAESWSCLAAALDLSARQLEIAQCVFDGLSEPAIGRVLGVSTSTVHTHLDRLYKKLRVHGRCELVVAIFTEYVSLFANDGRATPRAL